MRHFDRVLLGFRVTLVIAAPIWMVVVGLTLAFGRQAVLASVVLAFLLLVFYVIGLLLENR